MHSLFPLLYLGAAGLRVSGSGRPRGPTQPYVPYNPISRIDLLNFPSTSLFAFNFYLLETTTKRGGSGSFGFFAIIRKVCRNFATSCCSLVVILSFASQIQPHSAAELLSRTLLANPMPVNPILRKILPTNTHGTDDVSNLYQTS
jgi:hypothetical protein